MKENPVIYVDDLKGVAEFFHYLYRSDIRAVGIDTEYRPGLAFDDRGKTENFTLRQPLLLSAAALRYFREKASYRLYVFDLRKPEVTRGLVRLNDYDTKYVGHFLNTDLLTLLGLGIKLRGSFYDTYLAEKSLELGKGHRELDREHEKILALYDDNPELAEEECQRVEDAYYEKRYSLEKSALRYGVEHQFAKAKERLQKSFVNMPLDRAFTQEQIDYAAEDARVSVDFYLQQYKSLSSLGMNLYLERGTFPLIPHLADSQWHGLKIDVPPVSAAREAIKRCLDREVTDLKNKYRFKNHRSHKERISCLKRLGLLGVVQVRGRGKISLNRKMLKKLCKLHPFFKELLKISSTNSLLGQVDRLIQYLDSNGYIHPQLNLLGAKTTRITTTRPSPFDKRLRPAVVPSTTGRGLFELDVSVAEVILIALMSGDQNFQRLCMNGDVYLKLGAEIAPNKFESADLEAIKNGSADFENLKTKYKLIRDGLLKPVVLALMYGRTAKSISDELEWPVSSVQKVFADLKRKYPKLFDFIEKQIWYGGKRGFVRLPYGLRIHVEKKERWENRFRNNPIQGMCSVLFNIALLNCYEVAHRLGAKIILPLYDAMLVDCPLDTYEECIRVLKQIMENAFQSQFPDGIAKVCIDVNDKDPRCWNKNGLSDSLEKLASFDLDDTKGQTFA